MSELIIYEAGLRMVSGGYATFIESPDKSKVLNHLEIMESIQPEGSELVFIEKVYKLISQTPYGSNSKLWSDK
jgi:hypothetical protein